MDKTRTITFTPQRPENSEELYKTIAGYVKRDKLTIAEIQWIFDEVMKYAIYNENVPLN